MNFVKRVELLRDGALYNPYYHYQMPGRYQNSMSVQVTSRLRIKQQEQKQYFFYFRVYANKQYRRTEYIASFKIPFTFIFESDKELLSPFIVKQACRLLR